MTTINETILTTVVNTMVERAAALEAELAACKAELAESTYWKYEAASSELLLDATKAELEETRREFDVVEGALDFWQDEAKRKQDLLNAASIVISEYNQYFDDIEAKNEGIRI